MMTLWGDNMADNVVTALLRPGGVTTTLEMADGQQILRESIGAFPDMTPAPEPEPEEAEDG